MIIKYLKTLMRKWSELESKHTQRIYGKYIKQAVENVYVKEKVIVYEVFKVEFLLLKEEEFILFKEQLKNGSYKYPFKNEYNPQDGYSYIGTLYEAKSTDEGYYGVFQNHTEQTTNFNVIKLKNKLDFNRASSTYYRFQGKKIVQCKIDGVYVKGSFPNILDT